MHLIRHFEHECKKISRHKRCMEFYIGEFGYTHFNVSYLKNMISLMVYSMYKGYIPVINVNHDNQESIQWEWYFEQPSNIIAMGDISEYKREKSNICIGDYKPTFMDIFNLGNEDFLVWSFLFQKLIIFNNKTNEYIQHEMNLIQKGKTLGLLLRGTDYITLKPKGHPIQPKTEEVLRVAEEWMHKKGYKYIYVATEEKRLLNMVIEYFGEQKVLTNNRSYYDEKYYKGNPCVISSIKLYDENDNYKRGLEYLSSLVILGNCDGLISGNSGGVQFALYYSKTYKDIYVFNKGFYH